MTSLPATWRMLLVTLPTGGATARMRLWRAVNALGCAALRDGAYLLPASAEQAQRLDELAEDVRRHQGQAWVLAVSASDAQQQHGFRSLFDRSRDYARLEADIEQSRGLLAEGNAVEVRRLLDRHRRAIAAIQAIDFFPNETSANATAAWEAFRHAASAVLAPGEPHAANGGIIPRDPAHYQGRRWATRRHLWVDRIACAWLIRRFIDPHATFLWLADPHRCPDDAVGFDFDGATFTHVGDRVSFEVLLASFALEEDRALARIAAIVHALDIGGDAPAEAAGFEATLSGLRQSARDDDQLLAESAPILDALHRHFSSRRKH